MIFNYHRLLKVKKRHMTRSATTREGKARKAQDRLLALASRAQLLPAWLVTTAKELETTLQGFLRFEEETWFFHYYSWSYLHHWYFHSILLARAVVLAEIV